MKRFEYKGFKFLVFEDVYEPSDDTFLLADNLEVYENEHVLDMGTGCGILAILAGNIAKRVVGVDISDIAVINARVNVALNNMEKRVEIRLGNLWAALNHNERFSLILFNPPYLPVSKDEPNMGILEKAWNGGKSGREVIMAFLSKINYFLERGGRAQIVLSSLSGVEKILSHIKKKGFQIEIRKEKNFFFEKLFLINLTRV
ncbi:MAG: methyltransferase [Candidatus Jordarchaeaceae archaeon]